jgi:cell division protein FtsQ
VVTTVSKLQDKISYLNEIIENREPGTIVMLEADTYMPYSAQTAPSSAEEPGKT